LWSVFWFGIAAVLHCPFHSELCWIKRKEKYKTETWVRKEN
jgi:hypothetical protein